MNLPRDPTLKIPQEPAVSDAEPTSRTDEEAIIPDERRDEASHVKPGGTESLKRLALRGSAWTMVGRVVSQVLRLAGNLALSRLLFPEAFGISAIVSVYQQSLIMFSDLGLDASVIHHKKGEDARFLNTTWTIQVVRGLGLSLIAAALAWPMAVGWFRKPELWPMLLVTSLMMTVQGFRSTKTYLASRNMMLGRLTIRNLIGQVSGLLMTVVLAFWLRSAWALVIGSLLTEVVILVLSFVYFPGPRSRFCWDREVVSEVMRYGRWIFLSTILAFLSNQGDRFLMARYLPVAVFGLYNIAFTISAIPLFLTAPLGAQIVFPTLSRIARTEPQRLPALYHRMCTLLYLASMPVLGLIFGSAPLVVDILFDSRYTGASWIARWLVLRGVTESMTSPGLAAMMAIGRPSYSAVSQGVRAATIIIGIPLAWHWFGSTAGVAVAGLSGTGGLLVAQWALWRHGLCRPLREVMAFAVLLVAIAAGFGLDRVLGPFVR